MKKVILYNTLFILFSCTKKDKEVIIPNSIIQKDSMAHIIMQIHLSEAKANISYAPDIVLNTKINFQEILEKNNLTQTKYDSSMAFYVNNPKLFNEVYEIVIVELSKKQSLAK